MSERQIAEAFEEAHAKGIVHRDLKPQNVKVTDEEKAKVLDFGLARAVDPGTTASSRDLAHSPTLTSAGTQLGVILRTAAFMSPEQAKGKPVDKRADIWAFGVVLFEMLSGTRLFGRRQTADRPHRGLHRRRRPTHPAQPADRGRGRRLARRGARVGVEPGIRLGAYEIAADQQPKERRRPGLRTPRAS